ncbi:MAG: tetratricopeptide repeat protein [Calditrichaeota bacterium]|nr:tetratricopeptide repeat protein [Calditrichota bacterium]
MDNFLSLNNLEQFCSQHPDSVAFAFLATRYLEQGNIDRAIEICKEGIARFPKYGFGHFVLGLCYYYLKDYPAAKSHLELVTAYDPNNPRAWKLLGEINEQLDLPILAKSCFQKYYLLDPLNEEAIQKVREQEEVTLDVFEEEVPEFLEETPESAPAEEATQEADSDVDLEDFFKDFEPEEKAEEKERVEEVFKEAVGDIVSETENAPEETAEQPEDTIEIEEKDDFSADQPVPENEFTSAMDNFFSELEKTEEELSAAPAEGEKPAVEPEADREAAAGESEAVSGEELLNFSQVVEDIISERKEEISREQEVAGEEESFLETEPKLQETPEQITEPETPEQITEPETPPAEKQVTEESAEQPEEGKFSKPPIITPTLGEIYISQGRFEEAIEVFQKLLEKDPDNPRFQRKIREIRALIEKEKNAGTGDSET